MGLPEIALTPDGTLSEVGSEIVNASDSIETTAKRQEGAIRKSSTRLLSTNSSPGTDPHAADGTPAMSGGQVRGQPVATGASGTMDHTPFAESHHLQDKGVLPGEHPASHTNALPGWAGTDTSVAGARAVSTADMAGRVEGHQGGAGVLTELDGMRLTGPVVEEPLQEESGGRPAWAGTQFQPQSHIWADQVAVLSTADNTPIRNVTSSGFAVRRITHDGEPVVELTIEMALSHADMFTGAERLDVWDQAVAGVESFFNAPGHWLPTGERLHVTVKAARPGGQTHLMLEVTGGHTARPTTPNVLHADGALAGMIGNYLNRHSKSIKSSRDDTYLRKPEATTLVGSSRLRASQAARAASTDQPPHTPSRPHSYHLVPLRHFISDPAPTAPSIRVVDETDLVTAAIPPALTLLRAVPTTQTNLAPDDLAPHTALAPPRLEALLDQRSSDVSLALDRPASVQHPAGIGVKDPSFLALSVTAEDLAGIPVGTAMRSALALAPNSRVTVGELDLDDAALNDLLHRVMEPRARHSSSVPAASSPSAPTSRINTTDTLGASSTMRISRTADIANTRDNIGEEVTRGVRVVNVSNVQTPPILDAGAEIVQVRGPASDAAASAVEISVSPRRSVSDALMPQQSVFDLLQWGSTPANAGSARQLQPASPTPAPGRADAASELNEEGTGYDKDMKMRIVNSGPPGASLAAGAMEHGREVRSAWLLWRARTMFQDELKQWYVRSSCVSAVTDIASYRQSAQRVEEAEGALTGAVARYAQATECAPLPEIEVQDALVQHLTQSGVGEAVTERRNVWRDAVAKHDKIMRSTLDGTTLLADGVQHAHTERRMRLAESGLDQAVRNWTQLTGGAPLPDAVATHDQGGDLTVAGAQAAATEALRVRSDAEAQRKNLQVLYARGDGPAGAVGMNYYRVVEQLRKAEITLTRAEVQLEQVRQRHERESLVQEIAEEYGILLDSHAGVTHVKLANPNAPENLLKRVQPQEWSLSMLRQLHAAISYYAPILGKRRESSSRSKENQEVRTVAAVTWALGAKNHIARDCVGTFTKSKKLVNVYTSALSNNLVSDIKPVVTHELAHGLLDYALPNFSKEFWEPVEMPALNGELLAKNPAQDFAISIGLYLSGPELFGKSRPRHSAAVADLQKRHPRVVTRKQNESISDAAKRISQQLNEALPDFKRSVRTWTEDGRLRRFFPERPPTEYAETNSAEDIAETANLFFTRNDKLRAIAPLRAGFFDRLVKRWGRTVN
ncbi:hypothetical protein ACFRH6_33785 [Streptomyces sp. NPDC056749]|uniref:hypothetical protein n=1 Tax=Streptomyces sp. NPDC056749 TaxID=3345936 RepID=UPI00368B51BE